MGFLWNTHSPDRHILRLSRQLALTPSQQPNVAREPGDRGGGPSMSKLAQLQGTYYGSHVRSLDLVPTAERGSGTGDGDGGAFMSNILGSSWEVACSAGSLEENFFCCHREKYCRLRDSVAPVTLRCPCDTRALWTLRTPTSSNPAVLCVGGGLVGLTAVATRAHE